jgi:hypothetical protein
LPPKEFEALWRRSHLAEMPADAEPNLGPEIAHVLSLDVVGYSELPINQQVELLNYLDQVLLETPFVPVADYRLK